MGKGTALLQTKIHGKGRALVQEVVVGEGLGLHLRQLLRDPLIPKDNPQTIKHLLGQEVKVVQRKINLLAVTIKVLFYRPIGGSHLVMSKVWKTRDALERSSLMRR